MKRIAFLLAASFCLVGANAQNVGIGLSSGIGARLHVAKPDSGVVIIENTSMAGDSVKSRLYFKTGGYFTGAVGTHITSTRGLAPSARLGLYTSGNGDPAKLKERLSITNNGNVGIGTVVPTALLDINGTFRLRDNGASDGKVLTADVDGNASWQNAPGLTLPFSATVIAATGFSVNNTANISSDIAIKGRASTGVVGETSLSGTGVHGDGGFFGTGVSGSSFQGVGVRGSTSGIGGIGGRFEGNGVTGGKALITSGPIQFGAIGEGAGKVLTSDANGNANWQAPTSPSTNTAFSVVPSNDMSMNNGASTIVSFNDKSSNAHRLDDGNNFNVATHAYVAPAKGVYSFNVSIGFGTGVATSDGYADFFVQVNDGSQNTPDVYVQTFAGKALPQTGNVSVVLRLNAGDAVTVKGYNGTGGTIIIKHGSNTNFSGYRLY